jgi:formate hydrogenlyase transcriptional activator
LIVATNRRLEEAVDRGSFRADLFYRVSVFPIYLPPLRERREDILPLAECFIGRVGSRLGRRFTAIEADSQKRLTEFSWPGNIRELQNVIEHSAILCDQPQLRIPASLLVEKHITSPRALAATLLTNERSMIEHALEHAGGRVSGSSGAAACLGVPASTLESKIRRLNIDKRRFR